MAADLHSVRQWVSVFSCVVHWNLIFDATFLLGVHHERPVAGCSSWSSGFYFLRPFDLTPDVIKLHVLQLKRHCNKVR